MDIKKYDVIYLLGIIVVDIGYNVVVVVDIVD
jgi:hypothetical protein